MSIVTYEGTVFDYINPTKEMININDILRSLPRLNRFVGHSSRAYSVGEHTFMCLVMAQKLDYSPREQLLTFVHDFTEAYVGDCPAPLKRMIPDFSVIEKRVEHAIYEYIGIEPPDEFEKALIKAIDLTMLAIEMRDLTVHDWKSFANDSTYTTMIDEPEFFLNQNEVSEDMIRELLEGLYFQLLHEVKGVKGDRD
jgi:uncharacterized protein